MADPLRRALLTEELASITETVEHALVLHQFIYWMQRKEFRAYMRECTARARLDDPDDPEKGWIYKKAEEMAEEIMVGSRRTVSRRMADLVERGFLTHRQNPQSGWDQTRQYRVNLPAIERALQAEGYSLQTLIEGRYWPLFEELLYEAHGMDNPNNSLTETANRANQPNGQADRCNGQADHSNGHAVHAIPETTTKNTTEKEGPAGKKPSTSPSLTEKAKPLARAFKAGGAQLTGGRIRTLNRWAKSGFIESVSCFADVVAQDVDKNDGDVPRNGMPTLKKKYFEEMQRRRASTSRRHGHKPAASSGDGAPQVVPHSVAVKTHRRIANEHDVKAKLTEHFDCIGKDQFSPTTETARDILASFSHTSEGQ